MGSLVKKHISSLSSASFFEGFFRMCFGSFRYAAEVLWAHSIRAWGVTLLNCPAHGEDFTVLVVLKS